MPCTITKIRRVQDTVLACWETERINKPKKIRIIRKADLINKQTASKPMILIFLYKKIGKRKK